MLPPRQDLRHRGSWGIGRTKHCNAQKIPKLPTSELTKRCNAQKFQNSGIYGQAMARHEDGLLCHCEVVSNVSRDAGK